MKKLFIVIGFVVLAMLSSTMVSNATTTIQFYLSVSDGGSNCVMPYSGYYCVRVFIKLNGNSICVHDQCNITNTSPTFVSWTCDEALAQGECSYEIYYDICRFTPPSTLTCCEYQVTSGQQYCWYELTSGNMTDNIHIN